MSNYVHNSIATHPQETAMNKKRAFSMWCIEKEVSITERAPCIGVRYPHILPNGVKKSCRCNPTMR